MDKPWVQGPALEIMFRAAGMQLDSEVGGRDQYPVPGGIFHVGDEVLLKVGEATYIGELVNEMLPHTKMPSLRIKSDHHYLWGYWSCVIGWRRP